MIDYERLGIPLLNHEGRERRVGVEIEFSGLTPKQVALNVQHLFGGEVSAHTRYESTVKGTRCGEFKIELDASSLKALADKLDLQQPVEGEEASLETFASDLLTKAAEQIVPWELVCPPLEFTKLDQLYVLVDKMREAGALGTRHSLRYAFGLHFNQELPDTDVATVLNYIRAFMCLYDWIADEDQIDISRRLTSYINHYGKDYILKVINPNYKPDQAQLIDDYIKFNPTRNRSMDMLPMFAYLDEDRVRSQLDDERINKRPTLHYRLPNCDIDNAKWNLSSPWQSWLEVERLANNEKALMERCRAYSEYLHLLLPSFENDWLKSTRKWLKSQH